ncbi:MAG: FAD-dependent oxidoreductase [Actinomycetota bacterium]
MSHHRIVVVGAGLSGLTAATTLLATGAVGPEELLVIEQEGHVGGRLATEDVDGVRFDHGAQFFTVRTDRFAQQVRTWVDDGAAVEWCRGFGAHDGYPRYRGAEGMISLARHLAEGLTTAGVSVITSAPALLRPEGDALTVTWPAASTTAEAAMVTAPIPVGLALLRTTGLALDPTVEGGLGSVDFHRVLAVLAVLDADPGLPAPGAIQQPDDPTFTFVADNRAKGIDVHTDVPTDGVGSAGSDGSGVGGGRRGVTLHASHARSAELWEETDEAVLAALRPEIERYCPAGTIRSLHLRRWRHAGPRNGPAERCAIVSRSPVPIVLAGDGFGGSKVEGAFSSGVAAAETLADVLG